MWAQVVDLRPVLPTFRRPGAAWLTARAARLRPDWVGALGGIRPIGAGQGGSHSDCHTAGVDCSRFWRVLRSPSPAGAVTAAARETASRSSTLSARRPGDPATQSSEKDRKACAERRTEPARPRSRSRRCRARPRAVPPPGRPARGRGARRRPTGASPTGASPTGASPTGASPTGASPGGRARGSRQRAALGRSTGSRPLRATGGGAVGRPRATGGRGARGRPRATGGRGTETATAGGRETTDGSPIGDPSTPGCPERPGRAVKRTVNVGASRSGEFPTRPDLVRGVPITRQIHSSPAWLPQMPGCPY
jgi:hypothetical protein